jgi:hypothetical protein
MRDQDDMPFRVKRNEARSDFWTPVESIGLQKPENLLLVPARGRAVHQCTNNSPNCCSVNSVFFQNTSSFVSGTQNQIGMKVFRHRTLDVSGKAVRQPSEYHLGCCDPWEALAAEAECFSRPARSRPGGTTLWLRPITAL